MKQKWIGISITIMLSLMAIACGFIFFSNRSTPVSEAQEDTFSIKVNKESVKKDKTFILNIIISSQQEMQSVDAQVTYDATFAEFLPEDTSIVGTDGILTLKDTFESPTTQKTYTLKFKALQVGECNFTLTNANYSLYSDLSVVTKGDGAESISIIENTGENDDSTLDELLVGQGDFIEPWDSDNFDYTIIVPEGTKELTYSATPAAKDAVVESQGPKELSKDDHVYTITVTALSGNQSVYTITVLFDNNKNETEPQSDLDHNLDTDLIELK